MTDLVSYDSADRRRRRRAETRFQVYGIVAIVISIGFLALMVASILFSGLPAFQRTLVGLDVYLDEAVIDPDGTRDPKAMRGPIMANWCESP